jgi:hypothetical protein
MDRLDKLSQYFNEKERKKLSNAVKESNSAFPVMSVSHLVPFTLFGNGFNIIILCA